MAHYVKFLNWAKRYLREARRDNLTDLINAYGIGEVNTTLLADALAYESGLIPEDLANAVLEDETHPLHDAVIDAATWYEERYNERD